MAGVNARYAASLTACICLALTLVLYVAPQIDPTIGNRRFHVGVEMAAAMVLVFIAAVLFGRFRRDGSRRSLFVLAAVVVLALDNLFSAVLTTVVRDIASGGFGTWAFAGNAMLGAFLLATAALLPDRPTRPRGQALARVLAGCIGLLGSMILAAAVFAELLPGAFADPPETAAELRLLSEHPGLLVAEAVTAACFGLAALGFARAAEEKSDELLKWLSIGSVIAGAAYLNYALFPSQFTELLYSGDLFFLATIAALAYGAVREVAHEEAALVRSAVLEERRRVARDLHDGVAQELAFISSQTRWFAQEPTDREPLGLIMDSVERALDESRGAIAALSRPMDEPLDLAVGHAASDMANRIGARLHLDLDEGIEVPPPWRDALIRISREAVSNAVRHGHARTVSLQLREAGGIWLRVTDDGNGFDPGAPRSRDSYGLTSMRERAETLGGTFSISSSPGEGATVEVLLP
jgi:signal transduction histidine kinase